MDNFDKLLNKLNKDIDSHLKELNEGFFGKTNNKNTDDDLLADCIYCPECGTRLPFDANFCSNCGCDLSKLMDETEQDFYSDNNTLTNDGCMMMVYSRSALSWKYHESESIVYEVMARQCDNLLRVHGIEVLQINIDEYVEDERTYENCYLAIRDAAMQYNLSFGPTLSVMIIGGDDCIPMPRIANPTGKGLEYLHSDLLYCLPNIYNDGDDLCLSFDEMNFNIGRLPLEDGNSLDNTLEQDINTYFSKVKYIANGIEARNILMTSTATWIPASTAMVDKLPLLKPINMPPDAIRNDMCVSPALDEDDENTCGPYRDMLKNSDLLIFNLHGTNEIGANKYYGGDSTPYGSEVNPGAVSPDMIASSNARVMNTVACFGARYVGYNRNDSMLLTAIYKSPRVVLFTGSCSVAFGRTGVREFENMMAPTAFSETFMKLYTLYLFKGMPAGRAFLQAKCDYFNYFIKTEDEEMCIATVLMFNLFGMPTLHVSPRHDVIDHINGCKEAIIGRNTPKAKNVSMKPRQHKVLMQRDSNNKGGGLLSRLRGDVDANLAAIRTIAENNIYQQLGLGQQALQRIELIDRKNEVGSKQKGYSFIYTNKSNHFSSTTFAIVDDSGRLIDAIHTK